jgi:ubiquinone/menaquinone biosynthesis C-methylase UbiE
MVGIAQGRLTLLLAVSLTASACTDAIYRSMNDPARDEWQQPDAVVQALKIRPGDVIWDLGAGGGYFTFPLAQATGPTGRVYAIDTDEDSLRFIRQEGAKRGGLPRNVDLVLAFPQSPGLPDNSVDLIFICDTYHHITHRTPYMKALAQHVRPGGRVAIIDFKPSGWMWVLGHTTAKDKVREEMASAGYRLIEDFDFLEKQHFQIFAVSAP